MSEPNPYESPKAPTEKPHVIAKGIQRWAAIRGKGRTRYIWLYGVLGWGVMTAVLWSFFMAYRTDRFLLTLALALVSFPTGGYFWGAWMWKTMEKKFAEADAEGGEDA